MRYFIPKELNTRVVQGNIFNAGYYWWCTGTTDVKSTLSENLVLTTDSSATEFGLASSSKDYGNYDKKLNTIEEIELVLGVKIETIMLKDIDIKHEGIYKNVPYVLNVGGCRYGLADINQSTIIDFVESLGISVKLY